MRPTRLLVFVFVLVLARWLGMRTGWPDALVLPTASLAGVALLDRLATAPAQRLGPMEWAATAGAAVVVGLVIHLAGGL
jgi:hypothetical protein